LSFAALIVYSKGTEFKLGGGAANCVDWRKGPLLDMTEERKYWMEDEISRIAGKLQICDDCPLRSGAAAEYSLPERKAVHQVLDNITAILFPGCHGYGPTGRGKVSAHLKADLARTAIILQEQVEMAIRYQALLSGAEVRTDTEARARELIQDLIEALPEIQDMLQDDIQAAYDGDPAANSRMEIMMSYPGIQAIATHRIAHHLYSKGVPLIPRIMSELAHSRTGIDIHPGARIGRSFFIDHGTGVVIGETSVIGSNVKIYQGVTLGAMSFPKDEHGNPIKGIKRHPNVEDNVTIYAEATILGDVTIGAGSIIGGNIWLTHSVPPESKVTNLQPSPRIKQSYERPPQIGEYI
jgi:serine O-acetyltransferase